MKHQSPSPLVEEAISAAQCKPAFLGRCFWWGYSWLTLLLHPVAVLWLKHRARHGKEDPARLRERSGHACWPRAEGRLIWLHAASVGESIAVQPLIRSLREQQPDVRLLLTTGTRTSAAMLHGKLPEGVVHQMAPVDTRLAIQRFLRHWQPEKLILVESELWPVWVTKMRQMRRPVAVVNGRMSKASYVFWRKMGFLAPALLQHLSPVLAQDEADALYYRSLGCNRVITTGNLKWDVPPLPASDQELERLKQSCGKRQLWLAASTHPGEDSLLIEAHRIVMQTVPGALLIIAPRHPHRGREVVELFRARGLAVAQRSQSQPIATHTQVYVADTMGELGLWYRLSHAAFVGGSLITHGGQNPLEGARLGCPMLAGTDMSNFAAISTVLEAHGALERIHDAESLAQAIIPLLTDKKHHKKRSKACLNAAETCRGALVKTLEAL